MMFQSTKNRLIFILYLGLVSWSLLLPWVNTIKISLGDKDPGVVSLTSINNISPYTDYIKYFILLLLHSF